MTDSYLVSFAPSQILAQWCSRPERAQTSHRRYAGFATACLEAFWTLPQAAAPPSPLLRRGVPAPPVVLPTKNRLTEKNLTRNRDVHVLVKRNKNKMLRWWLARGSLFETQRCMVEADGWM